MPAYRASLRPCLTTSCCRQKRETITGRGTDGTEAVDLKAAKAAKQKKIAIGGGLLFVALLVFSVPKTMKMMHPHHAVQAGAPRDGGARHGDSDDDDSDDGSDHATPTSVPVSNTTGAPVLTAQLAPAAREGQLEVLSASFKSKDPFKQLIDDSTTTATPATTQPADTPTTPAADEARDRARRSSRRRPRRRHPRRPRRLR